MSGGNYPMAGDDQRDRVSAIRLADGPGTSACFVGNVLIATGFSIGNVTERFPYGKAVRRSRGRERKIKSRQLTIEIGLQLLLCPVQQRRAALVAAPAPVQSDDRTIFLCHGDVANRGMERKLWHVRYSR